MRADAITNHIAHVADDYHRLGDAFAGKRVQGPLKYRLAADFGQTFWGVAS